MVDAHIPEFLGTITPEQHEVLVGADYAAAKNILDGIGALGVRGEFAVVVKDAAGYRTAQDIVSLGVEDHGMIITSENAAERGITVSPSEALKIIQDEDARLMKRQMAEGGPAAVVAALKKRATKH